MSKNIMYVCVVAVLVVLLCTPWGQWLVGEFLRGLSAFANAG